MKIPQRDLLCDNPGLVKGLEDRSKHNDELDPDAWAVEIETAHLLYGLVRRIQPTVALETGTHRGVSAAWIAIALLENGLDNVLYTVDQDPFGDAGPDLWARLGVVDRIQRVIADSRTFQPSRQPIDFAFFDAAHEEQFVVDEWDHYRPMMRAGTVAVFHDYTIWPGERPAVHRIAASEGVTTIVFPNLAGLAMLQVRGGQ